MLSWFKALGLGSEVDDSHKGLLCSAAGRKIIAVLGLSSRKQKHREYQREWDQEQNLQEFQQAV